jgi:hypothetical protein
MIDYKAYVTAAIGRRDYQLQDMEDRINRLWIDGKLTNEDREELLQLAADNARESLQVDVYEKLADLERRVYELEHPTDIYPIWTAGYQTQQHEIVRYDVTGDGELDLCQYNGGRAYTSLSIGKIEGWNMLDRELNPTHTITRDADGGYVVTPIPEPEPTPEPSEDNSGAVTDEATEAEEATE